MKNDDQNVNNKTNVSTMDGVVRGFERGRELPPSVNAKHKTTESVESSANNRLK